MMQEGGPADEPPKRSGAAERVACGVLVPSFSVREIFWMQKNAALIGAAFFLLFNYRFVYQVPMGKPAIFGDGGLIRHLIVGRETHGPSIAFGMTDLRGSSRRLARRC